MVRDAVEGPVVSVGRDVVVQVLDENRKSS